MPQDTDWVEDDPADVPRPDPALDKAKTALRGATSIGPRKAGLMDIVPELLGGIRESTIDPMAETIMHPINAARTLITGKGAEGAAKILQQDVDTLLGRTPTDSPSFQNVPIVGPMVAGTYAGVRQPLADASEDVSEGRYGSAARNVGKMAGVVMGLIAPEAIAKKAAPTTDALAGDMASNILKRTDRAGAAVEQPINGPRQGPPAPPPLSPAEYIRQSVREMMPKLTVREPERAPKWQTKHSRTAPAGIKLDPEQIDPELVPPEEAAPVVDQGRRGFLKKAAMAGAGAAAGGDVAKAVVDASIPVPVGPLSQAASGILKIAPQVQKYRDLASISQFGRIERGSGRPIPMSVADTVKAAREAQSLEPIANQYRDMIKNPGLSMIWSAKHQGALEHLGADAQQAVQMLTRPDGKLEPLGVMMAATPESVVATAQRTLSKASSAVKLLNQYPEIAKVARTGSYYSSPYGPELAKAMSGLADPVRKKLELAIDKVIEANTHYPYDMKALFDGEKVSSIINKALKDDIPQNTAPATQAAETPVSAPRPSMPKTASETPTAPAPAAQPASPVTREAPLAPAAAPTATAPAPVTPEAPKTGHVNPNLTIPDNPGVRILKPPADFPEDLMTRGERTGSKPMRMAEGVVEGSVAGAGRFENLRLAQQKELTGGYAERILDYMSGKRGTAEEVGSATQESLKSAKQRIKAPIYDKVNEMGSSANTNGVDLRKQFRGLKDELTTGNLKVQLGKDSTILKVLNAGIKSKGYLGFNQLRSFRTQIRSLLPAARKEIGTTAEMHINRMLEVVDESIEKAASTKPGLFQEWKTAQGKWADLKQTFNDSTAGKILKAKDPGKVHLMLKTAPLEDLRKVRSLVGEDQFSSLKARLVEDMMTKATEGELHPSGPVLGMGESTTTAPRFTGGGFRKQLESLGSERLQELFDKPDLENMYKLADIAERVGGKSGNRLGGLALNLPLLWGGGKAVAQALTGDAGGALTSALKTGGVALGTNLVARVMTRKGGPTMLRKLAEAVEAGNNKLPPKLRLRMPPAKNRAEAAFWGARVGNLMAEELNKKNAPSPPEDWEED